VRGGARGRERRGRQGGRNRDEGQGRGGVERRAAREGRGGVQRRRVRRRRPERDRVHGARAVAPRQWLRDPPGRRAVSPPVRRRRLEVLRRQGERVAREVPVGPRPALAAPVRLRDADVHAADTPRPRQLERRAGPRRVRPRRRSLRAVELRERLHPDEPRHPGGGRRGVRFVLRVALRSHGRACRCRRHGVRRAGEQLRAMPGRRRSARISSSGRRLRCAEAAIRGRRRTARARRGPRR
jgi:hypothetical protein